MASNEDTELLTEHFGYPPVSLLDDIINSINILADRALSSVEDGLLKLPPVALGFRAAPTASVPPTTAKAPTRGSKQGDVGDSDAGAGDGADSVISVEELARTEITNGTAQLETLLCSSIDKNFDVFEIYVMRNILRLRPDDRDWIELAHYRGLDLAAAVRSESRRQHGIVDTAAYGQSQSVGGAVDDVDTDAPSVDGINVLRRRLQASSRLHARLQAERAHNAKLLAQLRAVIQGASLSDLSQSNQNHSSPTHDGKDNDVRMSEVDTTSTPSSTTLARTQQSLRQQPQSDLSFITAQRAQLTATTAADATAPLRTTAAFVLNQLAALRVTSAPLRALKPSLGAAVAADHSSHTTAASTAEAVTKDEGKEKEKEENGGGTGRSWRQLRSEYVERETRKHLVHVRGLDLEPDGAVRGGEWQRTATDEGPGCRILLRKGTGREDGIASAKEIERLERLVRSLGGGGGGEQFDAERAEVLTDPGGRDGSGASQKTTRSMDERKREKEKEVAVDASTADERGVSMDLDS